MKNYFTLFCLLIVLVITENIYAKDAGIVLKKKVISIGNRQCKISVIRAKLKKDNSGGLKAKGPKGDILIFTRNTVDYALFLLLKHPDEETKKILWLDCFSDEKDLYPKTLSYVDFIHDEKTNVIYLVLANFKSTHGKIKLFKVNVSSKICEFTKKLSTSVLSQWPKASIPFASYKINTFKYKNRIIPQKVSIHKKNELFKISLEEKNSKKRLTLNYSLLNNKWKISKNKQLTSSPKVKIMTGKPESSQKKSTSSKNTVEWRKKHMSREEWIRTKGISPRSLEKLFTKNELKKLFKPIDYKLIKDKYELAQAYDRQGNFIAAFKVFKKMSNSRNLPAKLLLANYLQKGRKGIKSNPTEARKIYQKIISAVQSKSAMPTAQEYYLLGLSLKETNPKSKASAESIKAFEIAANSNYAPALCRLGECYWDGYSVRQNMKKV